MGKTMVKHDAEMFALGVLRGRRLKIEHLEKIISKKTSRIYYLETRIMQLAKKLNEATALNRSSVK